MNDILPERQSGPARILLFSQRNIYKPEAWRCTFDEFEGVLQNIDSVDVLAARPGKFFELRRNHAQRIGKFLPIVLNPGMARTRLDREYDLFLAVCEKPSELLIVDTLKGWTERCRTSVCWLPELWIRDMPYLKASLKVAAKFDHIFLNVARTVEPLSRAIDKECLFLPSGIDALSFSPYPNPPERFIDVLSIGRRSERTHEVLLEMARQKEILYHYDTMRDLHVFHLEQHRLLMKNLLQRSRYFIVNPGKIDTPHETAGQIEFGYRYFEGAASGAVMIGDHPDSQEFREYFPWTDAVVHVPFGSDRIGEVMKELDAQPERQKKIRIDNIMHSLLNHDWIYRWERILNTAGLEPKPELLERRRLLREHSSMVGKKGLA
jgi:hypothetical protein